MYNAFLHRQQQNKANTEVQVQTKLARVARVATSTTGMHKIRSLARTSQWVRKVAGTNAAVTLVKGSEPLVHPDHHQFRDYSPVGNVYVRKYFFEHCYAQVRA